MLSLFVIGECPKCHYDNARGDQCDSCTALLNADELIKPKCSTCESTPERRKTRHLYLGLQHLTPQLKEWFHKSSQGGKWSSNSTTTTQGWINRGLLDRCITRDLKWGTPVPEDRKGFENKVFYVWFDAPIGYLSITACLTPEWEKWWKSNKEDGTKVELYQFMGKDNVPFHTVIFPSTLLGADDDYTMLHHINTTEYLLYEGGKFSKSRSLGVFGDDAEKTGIPASVWRYYLFTNRPETSDSDFTWTDLQAKCNSELNDNLGNFVNRTLSFTKTKFGGVVPNMRLQKIDKDFIESVKPLVDQYIQELEAVKIKAALRTTMAISKLANAYLQSKEPWKHIKKDSSDEEKENAATTMAVCIHVVRLLAYLIQPYMPAISDRIAEQLNIPNKFPLTESALDWLSEENVLTGHEVAKPEVLFKKITNEQVEILKRSFMGKDQLAAAQGVRIEGAGPEFPLDLVVGKIVDVTNHPTAEHLWVTQVQLGERKLQVVTNLRTKYDVNEFKDKSVVVITNIKKSKFQGQTSEAMLLAAVAEDGTTSLVTSAKPHGTRVVPKGATIKVKAKFKYKKAFKALEGRTDDASVPMFLNLPLEAAGEQVSLDKPLPGVELQ